MNKKIIIIISIVAICVISILIISIPQKEVIECNSLYSPNQNIIINLCGDFDISFFGSNQTCTFWNVDNKVWYVCNGGINVK